MESLTSQIRTLYASASEEEKRQIHTDLRDLQTDLTTEWDLVVRLGSGYLQMALIKILSDLSVLSALASSPSPLSLSHFISTTGVAPKMLGHLLRGAASFGIVQETGTNEFAPNRMTRVLADENVAGAIAHAYDVHAPTTYTLPAWLAEKGYKDVTSNKDLPFQMAVKTDLTPFEWMKQRPEQMKALGHAMAIQREEHWVDTYPVTREVGNFTPAVDSALLVDVGGGFGQQSVFFKTKFPELKGRIVVQDIPETLDRAPKVEGIEFQAHDFYKEQPIKSAKFYYFRHILHDWTDEQCVSILKAVVPAMGPESRVVIDEVVLPEEKLPWQTAYMDLTMMACLGGVERTKTEFEQLLHSAGLTVVDIHKYDPKMQSVILAAPK